MKSYERILVHVSGEEGCARGAELIPRAASELAQISHLTLAEVVGDQAELPGALRRLCAQVERAHPGAAPTVDALVLVGDPVTRLTLEVLSAPYDLVLTSARDPAVALRLMRACPCPVWIGR